MKKTILSILGLAMFVTSCGDSKTEGPVVISPVNGLEGTISEDVILDGEYALTGAYIVPAGKTLTIKAGTKIVAEAGGTEVYIGVNKGATINVEGTTTNPVVISSIDGENSDWGGLVICGKGITSAGEDVKFEVGGFLYGGTVADDSSGSIKNLVIRGSGAQINADSQYNGISFCAVGSGTIVENIAIINGGDDGVEFYGGSVSATNLYLENNLDDAIDWTESWDGSVTNAYISHSVQGFSTAFEGDKTNANPTFSNITAVSSTGGTALQFKKESGASITNLYLEGYDLEIDFKDNGAHSNVQIDAADSVIVDDSTSSQGKLVYTKGTKLDISGWGWISAIL
jgi:hypothetical protein